MPPRNQNTGGAKVTQGRVEKNKQPNKQAKGKKEDSRSSAQIAADWKKELTLWLQQKPRGKDLPYKPDDERCTIILSTPDSMGWYHNQGNGYKVLLQADSFNPMFRIKRSRPSFPKLIDEIVISSEHMQIINKSADHTVQRNFIEDGLVTETSVAELLQRLTIPTPDAETLKQLASDYSKGISTMSFETAANLKDPIQVFLAMKDGKEQEVDADDQLHDLVGKLRSPVRCTIIRSIVARFRYARDAYWMQMLDPVLKNGIFPLHEPFKKTIVIDEEQTNLQQYFNGTLDLPKCAWMRKETNADDDDDDTDDFELEYGKFCNRRWFTSLDEWCIMLSLACISEVKFQQNALQKVFNNKRVHRATVTRHDESSAIWIFKVSINCPDQYTDPKIPVGTTFWMWLAPEDMDMDAPEGQDRPADAVKMEKIEIMQGRKVGLALQFNDKKNGGPLFTPDDVGKKVILVAEFNKTPARRSFDAIQRIRKLDRCWLTEYLLGRGRKFDSLPGNDKLVKLLLKWNYNDLKLLRAAIDVQGLNMTQKQALDLPFQKENGLTFLQGPPGTGKSEVISWVASIANLLGVRCVVCAPSQAATLAVARKLASRIARIEDKADPSLARKFSMTIIPTNKQSKEMARQHLGQARKTAKYEAADYRDTEKYQWFFKAIQAGLRKHANGVNGLGDWHQSYVMMTQHGKQIGDKKWNAFWKKLKTFHEAIEDSSMVISTCNNLETLREGGPDFVESLSNNGMVIIDEAGFDQEWSEAIPLSFNAKMTLLVGDHKQLQPVVQSSSWSMFCGAQNQVSFFERCCDGMDVDFERLQMSYRLPKELSPIVGQLSMYRGLLGSQRSGNEPQYAEFVQWFNNSRYKGYRRPKVDGTLSNSTRRIFLNVRGRSGRPEGSLSTVNYANINVILDFITDFRMAKPNYNGRIIIQVPFSAQLLELYEQMDIRDIHDVLLMIGTIDSFQGEEGDIVITCLTPANSNNGAEIGFLGTWNRMNVAISRPRHALVLVGNMDCWRTQMPQLKNRYEKFAMHCMDIIQCGDIFDVPAEDWLLTLPADKAELDNKVIWSMASPASPVPMQTRKKFGVGEAIRDAYVDGSQSPKKEKLTTAEEGFMKQLIKDRAIEDEHRVAMKAKARDGGKDPQTCLAIDKLIRQCEIWKVESTEGMDEKELKAFWQDKDRPVRVQQQQQQQTSGGLGHVFPFSRPVETAGDDDFDNEKLLLFSRMRNIPECRECDVVCYSSTLIAPTRGATRPQLYQVIGLSIFNVCLGAAIQVGVEMLLTEVLHIRSALRVTTTLPMPWAIFKDLARGLFFREIIQYYSHRFILHPTSPNFVSKLHQQYFHSITSPYSFSSHYDHPLPYLLFRFLPTYLPSAIFRTHLLTYLLLLSLITLEETMTLSGYSTVPGIMLGGIARRQDLHSEGKGKGNYAPWGLLDWVHGTSIGQDVVEDMRDEADKHQVKERGGNAWDNAKESGKEGVRALSGRRKSGRKG